MKTGLSFEPEYRLFENSASRVGRVWRVEEDDSLNKIICISQYNPSRDLLIYSIFIDRIY